MPEENRAKKKKVPDCEIRHLRVLYFNQSEGELAGGAEGAHEVDATMERCGGHAGTADGIHLIFSGRKLASVGSIDVEV